MLKKLTHIFLLAAMLAGMFALKPAISVYADSLAVANTNDSGTGSLRQAIADAVDGDIIDATGISGTITLTSEIVIGKNLTIIGPGSGFLTVSGNLTDRVFQINNGKTISITGLTVANGRIVDFHGGGINISGAGTVLILNDVDVTNNEVIKNSSDFNRGGGIYIHDGTSLIMSNGTVSGNKAQQNGGGIHVSFNASISLTNVVIDNNQLEYEGSAGGGISIRSGSTATFNQVTVSNNTAKNSGGGLYSDASLTITNSVFSGNSLVSPNSSGSGGGLYVGSSNANIIIKNTTISGNSASNTTDSAIAGGIILSSPATLSLNNVTVTNNTSQNSGGGVVIGNNAVLNIGNSIISGNTSSNDTSDDCSGILNSSGYNLIQVTTGCTINGTTTGNITGSAAELATLGNNGGSTLTHALLSTSPALDSADNATCETEDQRGVARPQDGDNDTTSTCDMGAYEFEYDNITPTVTSITRASTNPTSASSVDFTVTFSEAVQNVDINDFIITKSSGVSGESVSAVSGSGATYTVRVNTGSGSGTLRLDVPVSASIQDLSNNALSGLPFTNGESYTKVVSATYKSNPANDGWILESSETSNTGGTLNSAQTTFILGDDAADKQYRAILHFDTSALPDTAVVTNMTLKIKQQGNVTGTSPFTFGSLYVDMRNPAFGGIALELTDFNFAAKKVKPAVFNPNPVSGWFSARFNNGGNSYVNRTGVSQLRLYFSVDDNNNNIADLIRFFSGNAAAGDRPKLLITYYVP